MNNLQTLEVGDRAPDFSLIDDEKQIVKLDDLVRGCGLILTFIHGTWCSACIQTLYRLRQYAHLYMQKDFNVAVVASDSQSALHIFKLSSQPPVDFSLLDDEEGRVRGYYGLNQTGAYYIIDSKKIIREVFLDPAHQGWPGHSRQHHRQAPIGGTPPRSDRPGQPPAL